MSYILVANFRNRLLVECKRLTLNFVDLEKSSELCVNDSLMIETVSSSGTRTVVDNLCRMPKHKWLIVSGKVYITFRTNGDVEAGRGFSISFDIQRKRLNLDWGFIFVALNLSIFKLAEALRIH